MLVVIPSYSGMGISPTDDSSVVSCKRSFQESRGISWEKGKFPEECGENYGGSNFAG